MQDIIFETKVNRFVCPTDFGLTYSEGTELAFSFGLQSKQNLSNIERVDLSSQNECEDLLKIVGSLDNVHTEDLISLTVMTIKGKIQLQVKKLSTVFDVKCILCQKQKQAIWYDLYQDDMVLDDDTFLQDCNLKENFSLRLRRGCVVGRTNVKVPTKDNEKPIGSEVSKYECEDAQIQSLKVGSRIISFNILTRNLQVDIVKELIAIPSISECEIILQTNQKIITSSGQSFFTQHPWQCSPEKGCKLFNCFNYQFYVTVTSLRHLTQEQPQLFYVLLTERNANYLPLGFLSHSSEYYIKVPNGRISVINALPSSSSKEIVKLVNEVLALAPADLAIVDESSNIVQLNNDLHWNVNPFSMLTAMTAAKNGFMCNSSIFMASGSHIPLGSIRSNDKILSSSFKITSIKRISKYKANIFLEVKFQNKSVIRCGLDTYIRTDSTTWRKIMAQKNEAQGLQVGDIVIDNTHKRLKVEQISLKQFPEWEYVYDIETKENEGLFINNMPVDNAITVFIEFPQTNEKEYIKLHRSNPISKIKRYLTTVLAIPQQKQFLYIGKILLKDNNPISAYPIIFNKLRIKLYSEKLNFVASQGQKKIVKLVLLNDVECEIKYPSIQHYTVGEVITKFILNAQPYFCLSFDSMLLLPDRPIKSLEGAFAFSKSQIVLRVIPFLERLFLSKFLPEEQFNCHESEFPSTVRDKLNRMRAASKDLFQRIPVQKRFTNKYLDYYACNMLQTKVTTVISRFNMKTWGNTVQAIYASSLLKALDKVPIYAGLCYKVLLKQRHPLIVGAIFNWRTIVSADTSLSNLTRQYRQNKQAIILQIISISGKNLESRIAVQEGEVVFTPFTWFYVEEIHMRLGNKEAIRISEIPLPTNTKDTILWVDDNPENNIEIKTYLQEHNKQVLQITSTQMAKCYFKNFPYILANSKIITDLVRIEKGVKKFYAGIELIEMVRAEWPEIKFQFLIFCGQKRDAEQNIAKKRCSKENVFIASTVQQVLNFCFAPDHRQLECCGFTL